MKIEAVVGMVFFCATILFLFYASVGDASASTLYVPDNYLTIQVAVDAANAGDVVIVRDGTYTENIDVNKSLTIRSENGYVYTIVQATNSRDHVFEITADYVNIIGFTVMGPTWRDKAGIYLDVDYCNISYNNILNHAHGILLGNSSNNTLMNNIASNNDFSIILVNSSNTMLMNNIASNNRDGIFLAYSSNNTLTNNTMSGNTYNFGVYGEYISHYIQNIDTSNKVDGKTIYYWVNRKNKQIPNNAGYVGIVNSTDIIVRDLTLMDNSHGVLLVYSSNSKIENVKVLNNSYGIYLIKSNNNSITNNKASNNYYGIYLMGSNNNTLINNNASNNWMFGNGIYLGASSNNVLMNNIASNNEREGIILWNSSKSTLMKNNASNNECGISLAYSDNNTLKNNIAGNNSMHGIYLGGSHVTGSNNNTLVNNNMSNNNYYGIFMIGSSYNMVKNNIASNNNYGIGLWDSSNNNIYLNNFINNTDNAYSSNSINIWNSTEEITYTYKDNQFTNYTGNYWSDYTGIDVNEDGIGDTQYNKKYNYPLMEPWENIIKEEEKISGFEGIFAIVGLLAIAYLLRRRK